MARQFPKRNPSFVDLTGQTFGRLFVFERAENNHWRQTQWFCKCSCGAEIITLSSSLHSGATRSCGCLRRERVSANGKLNTTHGHTIGGRSRVYRSWTSMKSRCRYPRTWNYKHYGGRGIKVCDRWANSFENFLADMGERPQGKTLDRFPDPDGNYEPGNCRWATATEQNNNISRKQRAVA